MSGSFVLEKAAIGWPLISLPDRFGVKNKTPGQTESSPGGKR